MDGTPCSIVRRDGVIAEVGSGLCPKLQAMAACCMVTFATIALVHNYSYRCHDNARRSSSTIQRMSNIVSLELRRQVIAIYKGMIPPGPRLFLAPSS